LYCFIVNNAIGSRVYCASYFESNLMNECYFERYLLNIYDLMIFKKINIFERFFLVRVMADDQIILSL